MANDIEGLVSSETFSQPYRADLHVKQPDRRPDHSGNCPVNMNSDSITDIAYFKGENLASDNSTVPNGYVRHHGIDESVYSLAPNGDEKHSFPSPEPDIYSAGSEDNSFSHNIIKLSEKVLETVGANCRNSSTKLLIKECVTSDNALMMDGHILPGFADEVRTVSEENDDTNSVTDLFAQTKISNDSPEVPLDPVSDKKLLAVDEGPCGSKRLSGECGNEIEYTMYESEKQMPDIMSLITKDLSEPYSIYTYRYFIHNWPDLCFLALHQSKCIGAIVCKLDTHKKVIKRGYIAMLAVAQDYRKRGIGSHLVIRAIKGMVAEGCDEVVLETEITNGAALHLYENLGFVRDKRLFRYYLNGVDALRLKLWLK